MGILSGLEKFGFKKIENLDVYDAGSSTQSKEAQKGKSEPARELQEEDYLLDKTFECPVCGTEFKALVVKVGKQQVIARDSDLRPKYAKMDALKYDAVVCPKCGFAALNKYFKATSPTQNKLIREQISANFHGLEKSGSVYSYEEAIDRHRLALMSTIVKRGKTSERAYCCLKLAWLYRGYAESISDEEKKKELKVLELESIETAYEGFVAAYSKERFPMCGMDELTVDYLIADLARQLCKFDIADRWAGTVILSKNANERVKNKARDLREQIAAEREQMNQSEE